MSTVQYFIQEHYEIVHVILTANLHTIPYSIVSYM